MHAKACLVVVGTFFVFVFVQNESRKLNGYKFPVYATAFCPRNETEWIERSSALNCNKSNGYTCLPNENFDQLLEYCYIVPVERIQKGFCLYLVKRASRTQSYSCRNFAQGCHNHSFFSNEIYKYPACISLGNGCFLAEPSCKSITPTHIQSTTQQFKNGSINEWNRSTNNDNGGALFAAILFGIFILLCILSLLSAYYVIRIRRRKNDEIGPLLSDKNHSYNGTDCSHEFEECIPSSGIDKDSPMEKSIFNQWKQDDSCFISTKACEEVEKIIKSRNLVIVAGHSGSGKSAIIQHIALKYKEQGWTVKRVKEVQNIVDDYKSNQFQENKTICVFNDPLGKESFDEILNYSWQRYEEEITTYSKTAKLIMSCRNYIIDDNRVPRYLGKHSAIVNISNKKHKFSNEEKIQILKKYTSNLSVEKCNKIVRTENYFPLLCKLYSEKRECQENIFRFFAEPDTVLKEEICQFKTKNKKIYLAIILLVLYNNNLCIDSLLEKGKYSEKFKKGLNLCGKKKMAPFEVSENLESLNGFLVKKDGDTYHFYHDFVMEVTTHVFGTDYPAETIKYADIGFLRRRVKLGNCDEHGDSFTINLSDRYIEELGERLYTELYGERLIDVVLNPCLRNENVIKVLKKKIAGHPENHYMLLGTKKLTIDKQTLDWTSKTVLINRLEFLKLENEVSPLFSLIVFCHTQLSLYCLNLLKQKHIDLSSCFSAVCCNGSTELFNYFCKEHAKEFSIKTWGGLCHIHIVSLFHNYDLLNKLIKEGVNVNKKTDDYGGWTPLMLAAANNIRENEDYNHGETGAERRDKTVQLLLRNEADINLCTEDGASPLFLACQNGHDSTVQLLLSNGADINLCEEDGTSPLYVACYYGHDSTVQILLSNGADIKLCEEDGTSPLYIACQNGHDSTVELLLNNRADINLCEEGGASPLFIACQNGHDGTVQRLLNNGADINICRKNGASPLYIACYNGHDSIVQLLLNNRADINLCEEGGASPLFIACQNGHDGTVQLLLNNGANINICRKNGASPLYIACFNGHDSTVQLLLSNGADINLCNKNGASPLYVACYNGHDSTVQILLSNGADIKLCDKDGASPLYIACQNGHNSTVELLLSNRADINLCEEGGASPLFIACYSGHDSTVQLLLSNGADIKLCEEDGTSPLYIACQNGHDSTVQILLSNGADIKLCDKDGASPLYIACQNGHDGTVQLLLKNGADINICKKNGASPLMAACYNSGASPLYGSCYNGHDSTVQILLSNGADINLCNKNGASPLSIACQNGHDSTVQLLLSNGADINLCNKNGASPLYVACYNGHDSTVQILLSNGADIKLCDKDGVSPLMVACYNGHDSTVQLLLSNGADINLCTEDGASPLYEACLNGHDSTVQLLLSNGADINLCMEDGTSPLCIACFNGHDSTIQLLLSKGLDINLCNNDRFSPLHYACNNGRDSTIQLLLNNRADINLCTKDRVSPLISAFVNRHYETVNILLNNGADSSLACGWEVNPALVDCFDKQDCTVVYLLQKDNISNNLYDPDSYFSLFVSCQVERAKRMTFLQRV